MSLALQLAARSRVIGVAGWRRAVWLLVAVLLGWAWWLSFAPAALGGPASYVITQGESMLPTFEPGGVVVTRAADHYEVGDVVAYENRQLHSVVLHRIVAEDNGRFVLQGDNNDFVDGYRPTEREMVGKQWFELPGAGAFVRLVQHPVNFALIMAATALVGVRAAPRRHRRRRRHHAA